MYKTCTQIHIQYYIKHNCTFNRLDEIRCTSDPYVRYRHSWKCLIVLNSVLVLNTVFPSRLWKFFVSWLIMKNPWEKLPANRDQGELLGGLLNPKPGGYINWRCHAARSHIWLLRRPIGEKEALRHAPPLSEAPGLHLEGARHREGGSKTAWCAYYGRGERPACGCWWRE
jgi:hypothetical protein